MNLTHVSLVSPKTSSNSKKVMKKQTIIIKYKSTQIRRTEGKGMEGVICKLEVEGISLVERSTDLRKTDSKPAFREAKKQNAYTAAS